jgi:hypothetical protein
MGGAGGAQVAITLAPCRDDKPIAEADTLQTLEALLGAKAATAASVS